MTGGPCQGRKVRKMALPSYAAVLAETQGRTYANVASRSVGSPRPAETPPPHEIENALQVENAELRRQHREYQTRFEELTRQLLDFQSHIASLTQEKTTQKYALANKEAMIKSLQDMYSQALMTTSQELTDAHTEIDSLKAQMTEFDTANRKLTREYHQTTKSLKEKLHESRENIARVRNDKDSANAENAVLKSRLAKNEAELGESQEREMRLQHEVKALRDQLKTLSVSSFTLSATSPEPNSSPAVYIPPTTDELLKKVHALHSTLRETVDMGPDSPLVLLFREINGEIASLKKQMRQQVVLANSRI